MSRRRRALLILAGLCGALAVVLVILIATPSGLRGLYRLAEPSLPDAFELQGLGGSVLRGVTAERVSWHTDDLEVDVHDLSVVLRVGALFRGVLDVETLTVASLRVTGRTSEPSGETATGIPEWEAPIGVRLQSVALRDIGVTWNGEAGHLDSLELQAALTGNELTVSSLHIVGDGLFLTLSGDVAIGPDLPVQVQATWGWQSADVDEFTGSLQIAGSATEYTLEHQLTSPFDVSSTGRVTDALGDWQVGLRNVWTELEVSVDATAIRSPQGHLELNGNATEYSLQSEFDTDLTEFGSLSTRIDVVGTPSSARIDELEIAGAPGRIVGGGTVEWSDGVQWQFDSTVQEVDVALLSARLKGTVNAELVIEGHYEDPEHLRFDGQVAELNGEINGQPLKGNAEFAWDDRSLSAVRSEVNLGDNSLQLTGSVSEDLDLEAHVELPDLNLWATEAGGAVTADVSVSGTQERPSVVAVATGRGLAWNGHILDEAEVELRGTQAAHTLGIELENESLTVVAQASGGLQAGVWEGGVASLGLSSTTWGDWSLEDAVQIVASAAALSVSEFCLRAEANGGNACFALDSQAQNGSALRVQSERIPLAVLSPVLPEGIGLAGVANTNASLRLDDGIVNGNASLSIDGGGVSAVYEDETLSADFSEAGLTLEVVDNALVSTAGLAFDQRARVAAELQLDDVLAAGSPVRGRVDLNVDDFSLLPILVPAVREPRGLISGTLTIDGTRAEPQLGGEVRLSDGQASVVEAGIEVTNLAARLWQRDDGRFAVEGRGTSGEGGFRLEGEMTPGSDFRALLDVRGERVEILKLPDQRLVVSPDVRVSLEPERLSVEGEITIPSAKLTLDALPAGAERSSPDVVVHDEDAEAKNPQPLAIDVRTTLGDDVAISGFGLQTRLDGSLRVSADPGDPLRGRGRLDLRDGEFEAYGQTLLIDRGELVFNGPLDRPQLDVRAIRDAGSVTAGVNITGTPDDLRSEIFSEPALSDAEALSYLLTGRPLASASSSEGNTLNQAAFALGLSRAGAVTEQIRSTLGLETLAVEGGSDSGRIVAGKQLSGRLFIEYGYGLVDQLGTLLLRYQLSDRLVLETSSGAATTLDLVYSVKKE